MKDKRKVELKDDPKPEESRITVSVTRPDLPDIREQLRSFSERTGTKRKGENLHVYSTRKRDNESTSKEQRASHSSNTSRSSKVARLSHSESKSQMSTGESSSSTHRSSSEGLQRYSRMYSTKTSRDKWRSSYSTGSARSARAAGLSGSRDTQRMSRDRRRPKWKKDEATHLTSRASRTLTHSASRTSHTPTQSTSRASEGDARHSLQERRSLSKMEDDVTSSDVRSAVMTVKELAKEDDDMGELEERLLRFDELIEEHTPTEEEEAELLRD